MSQKNLSAIPRTTWHLQQRKHLPFCGHSWPLQKKQVLVVITSVFPVAELFLDSWQPLAFVCVGVQNSICVAAFEVRIKGWMKRCDKHWCIYSSAMSPTSQSIAHLRSMLNQRKLSPSTTIIYYPQRQTNSQLACLNHHHCQVHTSWHMFVVRNIGQFPYSSTRWNPGDRGFGRRSARMNPFCPVWPMEPQTADGIHWDSYLLTHWAPKFYIHYYINGCWIYNLYMEAFVYCSFVICNTCLLGSAYLLTGSKGKMASWFHLMGFSQVEILNDTICHQWKKRHERKNPWYFQTWVEPWFGSCTRFALNPLLQKYHIPCGPTGPSLTSFVEKLTLIPADGTRMERSEAASYQQHFFGSLENTKPEKKSMTNYIANTCLSTKTPKPQKYI